MYNSRKTTGKRSFHTSVSKFHASTLSLLATLCPAWSVSCEEGGREGGSAVPIVMYARTWVVPFPEGGGGEVGGDGGGCGKKGGRVV